MPHSTPGSAIDFCALDEQCELRRGWPAVRMLLAGAFMAPGGSVRPAIERMLAEQTNGWLQVLASAAEDGGPYLPAEPILAAGGADLVLVDLAGPVGDVLTLVGRLRAAANESVVFIGVMPCNPSDAARLYLPAVVDALVQGPLQAAKLEAVTGALCARPAFTVARDANAERAGTQH